MKIGLGNLIEEESFVHVEGSRAFYTAKQALGGQRGPTNHDELKEARGSLPARPADSNTDECIARAGLAEVPVRVTKPSLGGSRATYLDIHGGGFFMDSATRSDARNARLADALGVTVVSVDVLLEDNLAMAVRLSAAGNDVDLRVFPEAMHGFTSHPTSMATAALDGVETWLSGRLDEH